MRIAAEIVRALVAGVAVVFAASMLLMIEQNTWDAAHNRNALGGRYLR